MSYAELHSKTSFSFLEGASHAEELVEQNVHPTIITAGYRMAADKAVELLTGASAMGRLLPLAA
jgi:glycerol-3-phosphate dehydrogenase